MELIDSGYDAYIQKALFVETNETWYRIRVGSYDKKPKQVKNWLNVLEKNFGNSTLNGVFIPSFDCSWNFASSVFKVN